MSEEEYNRLLKEFAHKVRTSITIRQSFERLIKAGMRTGRTDIQIGDDIRKELKGELDDRTIRRYLPESFKHMEKKNISVDHADRDPHIPALKHEVKQVEPESEYIAAIPRESEINTDPILDCRKFGTELRMGLMNNRKLRLKINRLNEVVEIQ